VAGGRSLNPKNLLVVHSFCVHAEMWGCIPLVYFGFVDFLGDLGGSGELGSVPAAAEGFD